MLYQIYESQRILMEPFVDFAQAASKLFAGASSPLGQTVMAQRVSAAYALMYRLGKEYEKPAFNIHTVDADGGDHDAEQHIAAFELKAAEAVSGNDRADNGEDNLGDNEAVGVDEGAPDADVAAVVLGDGVNVALQRGIGSQEADAGEDLGVAAARDL